MQKGILLSRIGRIPEGPISKFWQKSDLSTARFNSQGELKRSAQDDTHPNSRIKTSPLPFRKPPLDFTSKIVAPFEREISCAAARPVLRTHRLQAAQKSSKKEIP